MTTDALVRIVNLVKHFDISGGILDRIAFSGGIPISPPPRSRPIC